MITTCEGFLEVLERGLPVHERRPFQRSPEVSVLVRGYTLAEVLEWKKGRPCLEYKSDRQTLFFNPARWPQAVLERVCHWRYAEPVDRWRPGEALPGEPIFAGEGVRLFKLLEQAAPGVLEGLKDLADALSGVFLQPQVARQETAPAPACADLEGLLAAYREARCWEARRLLPQDLERGLYVGPYSAAAWGDAQVAALRSTGYDSDFGLPRLIFSALRSGPELSSPGLVPPELEAEVLARLPYGTALQIANLAAAQAEVQPIDLDFFGPGQAGT